MGRGRESDRVESSMFYLVFFNYAILKCVVWFIYLISSAMSHVYVYD